MITAITVFFCGCFLVSGGYLVGRLDGRKEGRLIGLEEGYADAVKDGWTQLLAEGAVEAPKPGTGWTGLDARDDRSRPC